MSVMDTIITSSIISLIVIVVVVVVVVVVVFIVIISNEQFNASDFRLCRTEADHVSYFYIRI